MKRLVSLITAMVLAAVALAGCGDDTTTASSGSTDTATTTTIAAAGSTTTVLADASAPGASSVTLAASDFGKILVDGDGMTLYQFAPDTGTASTCNAGCAQAWPPLVGPATPGDGIAADDLGTTTRDDGSIQVTYYGHPVYHFAGDSAAGDTSGQGSGGKWFVIDGKGAAVRAAATSPTSVGAKSGY